MWHNFLGEKTMKNYRFDEEEDRQEKVISVFTDLDGGSEERFLTLEVNDELPLLPVRNMVLYPGVVLPVTIGRKSSLRLVKEAERKALQIGVFCQKQSDIENPYMDDLYKVGVVAKVMRMLEMPDNTTTVILQGYRRVELLEVTSNEPYLRGRVKALNDIQFPKNDKETRPLMEAIKDMAVKFIRLSEIVPPDAAFAIKNINSSLFLVNFLCAHLPIKNEEKIELLMMNSLKGWPSTGKGARRKTLLNAKGSHVKTRKECLLPAGTAISTKRKKAIPYGGLKRPVLSISFHSIKRPYLIL